MAEDDRQFDIRIQRALPQMNIGSAAGTHLDPCEDSGKLDLAWDWHLLVMIGAPNFRTAADLLNLGCDIMTLRLGYRVSGMLRHMETEPRLTVPLPLPPEFPAGPDR